MARKSKVCLSKTHNTPYAYVHYRCRCPEAIRLRSELQREYRQRVAQEGKQLVPSRTAHRQIRAMMAMGHTGEAIGKALGFPRREYVNEILKRETLGRALASKISALYREISTKEGHSRANRRRAGEQGWATALAWDDIELDEAPVSTQRVPRKRPPQEYLYEYQMIRDSGMSHEFALRELGIDNQYYGELRRRAGLVTPQEKTESTPVRRAGNVSLHGMNLDGW